MWTFDVLSTKGNMPDSEGIAGSRGSLFKTLLDRDQYVTGLKNSSHWPWHLFWDGRRCVANTEERSSEATGSFHCSHPYLSFKRAIFLFFFKSNSWVFTGGWDQTITCVHAAFIPAKAKKKTSIFFLFTLSRAAESSFNINTCKSSDGGQKPAFPFLVYMNRLI